MAKTFHRFASLLASTLLALLPGIASAASPWEQHRGDCDSHVLSNPVDAPLAELSRCVRLLGVYRLDLLEVRGAYRQRVIVALRRVRESGDRSVAGTAKYYLQRMEPADLAPPEHESPTVVAANVEAQEPPANAVVPAQTWRILASGTKGLVAIDISGKRTPLFESATPIDSIAYDGAKELAWYVSDKRLWVLDLRADDDRPVVIATGLPVAEFEITGWSTVSAGLDDYEGAGRYNLDLHRYPIIRLLPEPKVEVGEVGAEDRSERAISPALIKRIKLVGAGWLKAQSHRPNVTSPPKLPNPNSVTLPKGEAYGCEESSLCGESSHLGGTGLELVLVSHACGDSCHTSCLLYDRTSKRFASPVDGVWASRPAPSSCEVEVAPDDAQYIVARRHCRIASRVVSCREYDDVNILGWVGRIPRASPTPLPAPLPATAVGDGHRFGVALDWLYSVRKHRFPAEATATRFTYEGGVRGKKCMPKGSVNPHLEASIARMSCFYDAVKEALDEEFFDAVGSGFHVEGTWTAPPSEMIGLDVLARSLKAGNFLPRAVTLTAIPQPQRAVLQRLQSTNGETWTFFRIFKPMMGAGGQVVVVGMLDYPEGPKVSAVLLFEEGGGEY